MTRTTAKEGMIEAKVGHGQKDFEFMFLEDLKFNDKVSFRNVLKGYEAQFKNQQADIEQLGNKIKNQNEIIAELGSQLKEAQNKINEIETQYLEALRGLITR